MVSIAQTWEGKVRTQFGGSSSPGFTVDQIFEESTQDLILRLEFYAQPQRGQQHLWAGYRTGTGSGTVGYFDLGAATSSALTSVTMEYGTRNRIQVTYGSVAHDFMTSFGYWDNAGKTVYSKAGRYLQEAGSCAVSYSRLAFDK